MKNNYILFLDDEENVLKSLQRMFHNEPYGVVTASNPQHALDIITREPIKVVFSDQRMPQMMGVEFLRRVKEKKPDIIRVLFTAYSDLTAAETAINVSEVYRYINKPWTEEELKSAVHQAMIHHDLLLENRRLTLETQQKNKELEAANRKLTTLFDIQKEFSATVSHELRTPLASIKAAIDIVMSLTPGPLTNDQKNFLGKAKDNIDRLNRLINDILDLAHLESGKTSLNIESKNLNDIIVAVVDMQQGVAKNKNLFLTHTLDSHIQNVSLDDDKVRQVLVNLMSNALKFTDKGGVKVISTLMPEQNLVKVSVEDSGPGIKKEDVHKLFHKFQQLGDPVLRKTGGTGLGLAICQEIVRQHGGKIWVESEVGKGSSFCFTLPLTGPANTQHTVHEVGKER